MMGLWFEANWPMLVALLLAVAFGPEIRYLVLAALAAPFRLVGWIADDPEPKTDGRLTHRERTTAVAFALLVTLGVTAIVVGAVRGQIR